MTEDQAKTKWCPFVRTGLTAGMAVNRHVADYGVYDETRCIGSGCMMWRAAGKTGWCGLASDQYIPI